MEIEWSPEIRINQQRRSTISSGLCPFFFLQYVSCSSWLYTDCKRHKRINLIKTQLRKASWDPLIFNGAVMSCDCLQKHYYYISNVSPLGLWIPSSFLFIMGSNIVWTTQPFLYSNIDARTPGKKKFFWLWSKCCLE